MITAWYQKTEYFLMSTRRLSSGNEAARLPVWKALTRAAEAGLAKSILIHEFLRSTNGLKQRGFARPAFRGKLTEMRS